MEIKMSQNAVKWFKNEYDTDNASFRFYVRYGGGMAGHIPGFSLGVIIAEPERPHTVFNGDGLQFFIEESDAWYFDDKSLSITYDELKKEPVFEYI